MKILRPDGGDVVAPTTPRAPRGQVPTPAVLTVIENGKPKARELLQMVGEQLGHRIALARTDTFSKPSAAKPIDADEARLMAARSHLVITGLGD